MGNVRVASSSGRHAAGQPLASGTLVTGDRWRNDVDRVISVPRDRVALQKTLQMIGARAASHNTRTRSFLTGGLLVAFVLGSYASVIRRTSQDDLVAEFEREIAEENEVQQRQARARAVAGASSR